MIEPCLKLWRRATVILRRTHDDDCINLTIMMTTAGHPHLKQRDRKIGNDQRQKNCDTTKNPSPSPTPPPFRSFEQASLQGCDNSSSDRCLVARKISGLGALRAQFGHADASRSAAARKRVITCSSPMSSSASNNGGPMVRPVTATRIGACALPSFKPRAAPVASIHNFNES